MLLHCSAGKDRTGVICAILLKLAGTTSACIADEYQLTEIGLQTYTDGLLSGLDGERLRIAREMMSAKREVMITLLEVIEQEYGGVETLCKKHVDEGDYEVVIKKLKSYKSQESKM